MRHIEDFELENLLNLTGSFFFRWRCRRHLKVCSICRRRMESLQAENNFALRLRKALKKFRSDIPNGADGEL